MNLQEKALAKLSLAALFLDLMVCVSLWQLIRSGIKVQVFGNTFLTGTALFFAVAVAYVFIVEVVFAGRSMGRLCLGISVGTDGTAEVLPLGRRFVRFLSILSGFGLRSLNANRLPAHNCAEGMVFRSDLAGRAPTRSKPKKAMSGASDPKRVARSSTPRTAGLTLALTEGPHAGVTMSLSDGKTFRQNGMFTIGRAAGWSDLTLSQDSKVSSMHCRLLVKDGRLYIADGADATRPSRNGTLLSGRPIGAKAFVPLPSGAVVSLGDSRFQVSGP